MACWHQGLCSEPLPLRGAKVCVIIIVLKENLTARAATATPSHSPSLPNKCAQGLSPPLPDRQSNLSQGNLWPRLNPVGLKKIICKIFHIYKKYIRNNTTNTQDPPVALKKKNAFPVVMHQWCVSTLSSLACFLSLINTQGAPTGLSMQCGFYSNPSPS